jgi:hypothetical protein
MGNIATDLPVLAVNRDPSGDRDAHVLGVVEGAHPRELLLKVFFPP